MDAATFRTLGHQLVDQIAELLESVPRGPVTRDESPSAVREALDLNGPLPETGTDPGRCSRRLRTLLFEHSLFNAHPRFFGYITAPPAPIGILGDFLAAAVNPNVGAWTLSPAATEIEAQTVRWIAELIGFPADGRRPARRAAATWPTSSASWRRARRTPAGTCARKGSPAAPAAGLRVYASAETHTWIQKAADLAGLGTDAIRWIPTDADLRMDVHALQRAARGTTPPPATCRSWWSARRDRSAPAPSIRCATSPRSARTHDAGSMSTARTAASPPRSPDAPDDLRALSLADSVAVDPHKWLYAPLEAGCALVRDPEPLRAAFAYHPPYYHFDEQATNYVDYGPQNSRGFRALKVWLALRQVGAAGYRAMIADDIRLSRVMADAVRAAPGARAARRRT